MADPIEKPDQEIWGGGRSRLQSEIDSKIVLAPSFGTTTKADPLEVDPTVK
jgi:hypothetical protein